MNAVVTYIFGKNKELLREPLFIDKDIKYICVTDQKDLKSKTWEIIYDEIPEAKCIRDKMVFVKYNPFKYTNEEKICVIDGTLEIKSSLLPLFELSNNFDLLVKKHPERNNLSDELDKWIAVRHMTKDSVKRFEMMAKLDSYNLKTNTLYESCVIVWTNENIIKDLCSTVIEYMKFLGNDTLFLSNQCILTYLMNTQYKMLRKNYINQKSYFNRYKHNTHKLNNK